MGIWTFLRQSEEIRDPYEGFDSSSIHPLIAEIRSFGMESFFLMALSAVFVMDSVHERSKTEAVVVSFTAGNGCSIYSLGL